MDQAIFSSMLLWLPLSLTGINNFLYHLFNGLAGRSWLFDNLVALPLENDLIKAGIIGACFFAAWEAQRTPEEKQAARKILLVTLLAAAFVIATTKTISHSILLPRPFVQSQKIYYLKGDSLIPGERMEYRVPLDPSSQKSFHDLIEGKVDPNDLESLPSDHTGFFVAISMGIWLASRRIGLLALGWTFFGIIAAKMIAGQHTPLDIIAGVAVAVAELALCQYVAHKGFGRWLNRVSEWTLQHSTVSFALLFVVVFEISSTLAHVKPLLKLTIAVGKHFLRGGS